MVGEGDTAPDFTLEGYIDGEISTLTLSSVLGEHKPAILAFYVYDYSPVCTDQVCELNDMEFVTLNEEAVAIGISTDGPYSHRKFANDNDLSYPLLSDGEREVYEQYGLLETDEDGNRVPRRGIVVVDAERTIRFHWKASDNWDEWTIAPLRKANQVVNDLLGE